MYKVEASFFIYLTKRGVLVLVTILVALIEVLL